MTNLTHIQLLDPSVAASDPGEAVEVSTAMTHATKPYFVEKGEARWYGNSLWEFLVPQQATGGELTVFQATMPEGFSPPRHIHTREDEVFLILEGEAYFDLDGERRLAGPGAAVYMPRGVPHTFRVKSPIARMLGVMTPGPRGYSPDFVVPLPAGPLGDIADDLAALRATPAAQIRADMRLFATQHKRGPEIAEPWLVNPRREVRRLAELLEGYWVRAIEPHWPRIRAFLDADIAYRARRLAAGGPTMLFADLSANVTWKQPELTVQIPDHDAIVELAGRGLLLVPSAFAATRPFVSDRPPWLPALIYPARGIATLWEQADTAPEALARLIGGTRATILSDLAAPRSTTELSDRLSLSPAAASHHLTTLRDAGLLSTRREGRSVLYVRTALGDTLAMSAGSGGVPGAV